MININHKMYKCHFCQESIDVYGIDNHFATFHKFRHSSESEYVCEFCDDFEEFHSQTNLFHHIQNTHNLTNDIENQSEVTNSKVDTLEEGKLRFLQLIVDFNSQEDVFNLLQWIKLNDANTFMTNHEKVNNQFLILEKNISTNTTEEDDEMVLYDDMDNTDSFSKVDLLSSSIFSSLLSFSSVSLFKAAIL